MKTKSLMKIRIIIEDQTLRICILEWPCTLQTCSAKSTLCPRHIGRTPRWQQTKVTSICHQTGLRKKTSINCMWFGRGRQIFGLCISLARETRADFAAFIIFDTEHILLVPVGHPLKVLHPLETFCVKDFFVGDVPQRKRRLPANRIEVDGQETAWRCLVFCQSCRSSFASESDWRRFCCFVTCSI